MSESTTEQRLAKAKALVDVVREEVWDAAPLRSLVVQEQFGVEHYVRPKVHEKIAYTRTPTTHHIRFAPDYFVVDLRRPERTYLLEYKYTDSPLRDAVRLDELKRASRDDLAFSDVGQWEAAAYDNYRALAGLGINVCVLNYVSFHGRPLLCESIRRVKQIWRSAGPGTTVEGSRTPWVNLDLAQLRSLGEFLRNVHGLSPELTQPLIERAIARLRKMEAIPR